MSAPNQKLGGAETERDPLDPTRLGQVVLERYEIVRAIAAGGMGAVYEARHLHIGRRVAVKFLRSDRVQDRKTLARFQQEAKAAGALESEHICGTVDLGSAPDGSPCLIMEFLDGENLAQLLEHSGPLPVPRAVDIVRQVCRGLAVAHGRHIVHRDLKPRNLIVCRRSDGTDLVKIVDFGIAKLTQARGADHSTTTGAMLGTPHYMPPEQARGEKQLDERADIYALGVILYELLTAQKPHPGDSYNAIIYHILSKRPVPVRDHRPEVTDGLARIVHRALATDVDQRQQSVRELERALAPYGPLHAEPVSPDADTLATADTAIARVSGRARLAIVIAFVAGAASASVAAIWGAPGPRAEAVAEPPPIASAKHLAEPVAHATPAVPASASPAPTPEPSSAIAAEHAAAEPRAGNSSRRRAPARTTSAAPTSRGSFDFDNPYAAP